MAEDVPDALQSFVASVVRQRDYFSHPGPQCRDCGSQMSLSVNRKTSTEYWRCTSVRCGGTRDFDDVAPIHSHRQPIVSCTTGKIGFEDKERAARIIARATELFGSMAHATKWLKSSKVGLREHGQTPLEAIRTVAGCVITEKLLADRFLGEGSAASIYVGALSSARRFGAHALELMHRKRAI